MKTLFATHLLGWTLFGISSGATGQMTAPTGLARASSLEHLLADLDPIGSGAEEADGKRTDERAARIVEAGPGVLPGVLRELALGKEHSERQLVLQEVVRRFGREAVLARLAEAEPGDEREAALRTLRALALVGGTSDLDLALQRASQCIGREPADEAAQEVLPTEVGGALVGALSGILERDERACRALGSRIASQPREIAIRAIHALGKQPIAGATLAGQLGFDAALDESLLAQLSREHVGARLVLDDQQVNTVRSYLWDLNRSLVHRSALVVLQLQDFGAAERLAELLEGDDEELREVAHRALRAMSGLELSADAARWRAWESAERVWFEDHAPELVHALDHTLPAEVERGLAGLETHRFERHWIAQEIARVLEREESELRRRACEALARLASDRVVDELATCLDDPEPVVVQEALNALRSITGWELSADAELWRQALVAGVAPQPAASSPGEARDEATQDAREGASDEPEGERTGTREVAVIR